MRAGLVAALAGLSVAAGCIASEVRPVAAGTPAGTRISNVATVTYSDGRGAAFDATSNAVDLTVAAVAASVVVPDAGCSAASPSFTAGRPLVETFTLTNAGNQTASYAARATASAGSVASVAFAANGVAAVGSGPGAAPALSPPVPAGATIQVVVSIATSGIPAGTALLTTIDVSRAGAAPQTAPTVATQCGLAVAGATIGGPGGASLLEKLVDAVPATSSAAGATVHYHVAFANAGPSAAAGAVFSDGVPAGIAPVAASVLVDGAAARPAAVRLAGQQLSVALDDVAPKATRTIDFDAQVQPGVALGTTAINVAQVSGENFDAVRTAPAAVTFGQSDVVYDGVAGEHEPIAGATTMLATAGANGTPGTTPIALHGTGVAPNITAVDPFVTGAGGTYALPISVAQAGRGTFVLVVTAPGYVPRRISLTFAPDPTGSFDAVTLTALDGLPLAEPGGFALAAGPVRLAATYGLFGNVPMFKSQLVVLQKSVDRETASGGDRLVYDVTVASGDGTLGRTTVTDPLPGELRYAPGTSRVDGVALEPARSGNVLAWTFSSLGARQHDIRFAAVVAPGVADRSIVENVASARAFVTGAGGYAATAQASATTFVISGLFSDRTVVVGRVYLDVAGSGRFGPPDPGVPGVRIFLEDGESVVTDATGRYDFPSLRPGMHVLRIDPATLPPGARFFAARRIDDERSPRRLLEDPYEGGVLRAIDFALAPVSR